MKKLKLLSLLIAPAVILPVAFSVTSCSAYSSLNAGYKVIDNNSINKNLNSLAKPSTSAGNLLWGGKGYNKGNYVLFITHSIAADGVSFLLNSPVFTKGDNPKIADDYHQTRSLVDTISNPSYKDDLPTTDYKYVVLVEEDTNESYCNDGSTQETTQPCSPFQKYTEMDEKVNSDHEKDKYIRNDAAAKAYRSLMDTINKLFKVDATTAGDFLAIQWVKGYPITDAITSGTPWINNSTFASWLYNNDLKGVSWK